MPAVERETFVNFIIYTTFISFLNKFFWGIIKEIFYYYIYNLSLFFEIILFKKMCYIMLQ